MMNESRLAMSDCARETSEVRRADYHDILEYSARVLVAVSASSSGQEC